MGLAAFLAPFGSCQLLGAGGVGVTVRGDLVPPLVPYRTLHEALALIPTQGKAG